MAGQVGQVSVVRYRLASWVHVSTVSCLGSRMTGTGLGLPYRGGWQFGLLRSRRRSEILLTAKPVVGDRSAASVEGPGRRRQCGAGTDGTGRNHGSSLPEDTGCRDARRSWQGTVSPTSTMAR